MGMIKGRARKFQRFSRNGFWKNIGCLISAPTFGLGGSRMWEKEEAHKISRNKSKRRSIRSKVGFYEVFLLYVIYCPIFIL